MIHRFNRATVQLVYDIEKEVAKRLGVDNATLCICSGPNNMENVTDLSICFETEEDDTWALLEFNYDPNADLTDLLDNFMINSNVEWKKRGSGLESDDEEDSEWGLDDIPALTTDEINTLREIIRERNA
jgi:hypothetical protein